jgi:hypothetical protein
VITAPTEKPANDEGSVAVIHAKRLEVASAYLAFASARLVEEVILVGCDAVAHPQVVAALVR